MNAGQDAKFHQDKCYLNDTAVLTMYNVLNIKDLCGIYYTTFFNMMQCVAENEALIYLDCFLCCGTKAHFFKIMKEKCNKKECNGK